MTRVEIIQKNLRDTIQRSGLSQKEIAGRIGVSPSTVSKYINLKGFPYLDTFAELCKFLGISADEMLGLFEYEPLS